MPESSRIDIRHRKIRLAERVDQFDHQMRDGEAVGIDQAFPRRVDDVGADDDVERAPVMHLQIALVTELQTSGEMALGTAHAFRHRVELSAFAGEETQDPVGLAQGSRAQHDARASYTNGPKECGSSSATVVVGGTVGRGVDDRHRRIELGEHLAARAARTGQHAVGTGNRDRRETRASRRRPRDATAARSAQIESP